jgi:cobaltochelatase CobN
MKKHILTVVAAAGLLASATWAWSWLRRPRILLLGFNDQLLMLAEKASHRSKVRIDIMTREQADDHAKRPPSLNKYRAILVNGLRAEPYPKPVQAALAEAARRGVPVLVLPPRQADIMRLGNADYSGKDRWIAAFYTYGGVENWARLLRFLSIRYAGGKGDPLPPVPTPENGFYHPDAPDIFTSTAAYRAWYTKSGREKPGHPWIAIDFAQGWRVGITQGTDALIRAFEKRNFNVAALFGQTQMGRFLEEIRPDLIINRSHGRFWQGERGVELLARRIDAPIIRGLSLMFEQKTIEEYRQTRDGVRGPGLAIGTVVSELDGTIEPTLIEGLKGDEQGRRVEAPIEERIQRLVDRAERWINLRRKPNADKRVAIVYFNGMGKADFTAAGLNVPESLIRFLGALRAAGYAVRDDPTSASELLKLMQARGRNVSEVEPGELERLAQQPGVLLLPAEDYQKWFARLPQSLQAAVLQAYGPPPGTFMTARRNGRNYFIVPALRFGNVVLLPQPARGAQMDSKLQHSDKVPPPHQYLAVYWWLQEGFHADALVHYGTHGTYEFLPGRPVGQLDDDWSDRVVGRIPNLYVYTMDNVGEALIAKRRGSAVLISYQTPPIQAADLSSQDADLAELVREAQRFLAQPPGALKENMRARIRALACKRRLDSDLRMDWSSSSPTDHQIKQLYTYLHELDESKIPIGLHVHSRADKPEDLSLTVAEILGKDFLSRYQGDRRKAAADVARLMRTASPTAPQGLQSAFPRPFTATAGTASREFAAQTPAQMPQQPDRHPAGIPKIGPPPPPIQAQIQRVNSPVAAAFDTPSAADTPRSRPDVASRIASLQAAFAETSKEIDAVLHALSGGYVRPGSGGDPVRTPSALPTGRNLYGVNPAEIPTQAAWDTGVALADQLLAAERKRLGRWPRKVGFNLWPTELVQQYGVDLAQALYLLGVKPVWDQRGIVIDLELIPASQLKRPRVDVVIQAAGQFRDSFPDRMELLDRAVRMAAEADDGENFISENAASLQRQLKESGLSARDARILAYARIFSNSPGGYGTGLTGSIMRSGSYSLSKELTREYLERAGAVYTQGIEWGKKVPALYEKTLQNTDAVSISRSMNTISALTLDHYFEYSGGMVMAIRDTTGQKAAAYIADVRDPNQSRVQTVEEALAADLRTKFWNRKWIAGMMESGSSGASEITKLADNLHGWQVTKPDAVQPYMWEEVDRIYVQDGEGLKLREWFEKHNPYAFQNLLATLLETVRKGYWKPSQEIVRRLADEYARSVIVHGLSGSERTAGNTALHNFIRRQLDAPGYQSAIVSSRDFNRALERSTAPTQSSALVVGQRLARQMSTEEDQHLVRTSVGAGLFITALACGAWLLFRRKVSQ